MTDLFLSWVEHRVMVIWWREPFDFEIDREDDQ
jgi:hypothetical protein